MGLKLFSSLRTVLCDSDQLKHASQAYARQLEAAHRTRAAQIAEMAKHAIQISSGSRSTTTAARQRGHIRVMDVSTRVHQIGTVDSVMQFARGGGGYARILLHDLKIGGSGQEIKAATNAARSVERARGISKLIHLRRTDAVCLATTALEQLLQACETATCQTAIADAVHRACTAVDLCNVNQRTCLLDTHKLHLCVLLCMVVYTDTVAAEQSAKGPPVAVMFPNGRVWHSQSFLDTFGCVVGKPDDAAPNIGTFDICEADLSIAAAMQQICDAWVQRGYNPDELEFSVDSVDSDTLPILHCRLQAYVDMGVHVVWDPPTQFTMGGRKVRARYDLQALMHLAGSWRDLAFIWHVLILAGCDFMPLSGWNTVTETCVECILLYALYHTPAHCVASQGLPDAETKFLERHPFLPLPTVPDICAKAVQASKLKTLRSSGKWTSVTPDERMCMLYGIVCYWSGADGVYSSTLSQQLWAMAAPTYISLAQKDTEEKQSHLITEQHIAQQAFSL